MYDDSQLIYIGSVLEGKTLGDMDEEINATKDKENRESWEIVPINIDDSPRRPVRITRSPEKYTPTPIPRPYLKFTKNIDRPMKNPLIAQFDSTSLVDVLVMETWLKIGLRKKKDDEGLWYVKREDHLPWRWDFTEVEVRSKTFFYTLWTEEEWLCDQV